MFFYFVAAIGLYLCIGYFLHLVVFPESRPVMAEYFTPGQVFYSKRENIKQTVVKYQDGHVLCNAEVGPFAEGPPKHIHADFDEYFEIANGELSVWLDGKVVKIRPGERLFIPKGTPHKPFNETGETIYTKEAFPFPAKFAFSLTQVYGVMDNDSSFGKSPKTLFQMSMFARNGFDSYLVDGPPVAVQKMMSFLLVPLSRLMGYRSYYEQYDIRSK